MVFTLEIFIWTTAIWKIPCSKSNNNCWSVKDYIILRMPTKKTIALFFINYNTKYNTTNSKTLTNIIAIIKQIN